MRGGARRNPGPKRVLTYLRRIELGAFCEREWRKAAVIAAEAQFGEDRVLPGKLEKKLANLREVNNFDPKDAQDEAAEIFGSRKRTYRNYIRRPKGSDIRHSIKRDAIKFAASKWGTTVSGRMVETAWASYRSLLKNAQFDAPNADNAAFEADV